METRDRLVTATTELFRRQGFHATSVKQIVDGSGAPNGSLYHFFPGGKDELGVAAITTSGAAYEALFELIADAAGDPARATTDFFEGAADALVGDDYLDICPIGTVAREVASTNEALRVATDAVIRSWIDAATRRFVDAGVERTEAEDLATTIVAALEGGFLLARAGRDADRLRTIGRQIRRLVDAALPSR